MTSGVKDLQHRQAGFRITAALGICRLDNMRRDVVSSRRKSVDVDADALHVRPMQAADTSSDEDGRTEQISGNARAARGEPRSVLD